MTDAVVQTTFKIPNQRLEELYERIDQLNARARKLGLGNVADAKPVGDPWTHRYARSEAEQVMGIPFYTGRVTYQNVEVTKKQTSCYVIAYVREQGHDDVPILRA